MKILPWIGTAAVLAAGVLTSAQTASAAEAQDASAALVEDFTHPGADMLLSEYGLKVLTGDGGIMFSSRKRVDEGVQCPITEIQVTDALGVEPFGYRYCFKTFGTKGLLTLEIPGAFNLRAGNNPVVATAETDDGTKTYQVPANRPVPIDPGDGELPTAILVEMRFGPVQAIGGSGSGGAAADDSYRFAAKIDVSGVRACSGALVAPQWIVTSAACFAEDGNPVSAGAPPRPAMVSIGHGTTVAKTATVTTLVPHADRNVVLAKLNTWITGIDPVQVGTTAPATGDVLRAAGYGRTATEWVPEKLHTAAFTVKDVRAGALDLTRQDAAAGICKGDSGGPLLREFAGRVELVAIHHTAEQKGCLGSSDSGQDAVETRLDDLGDWLAQTQPDNLRGSIRFGRVTGVAGKCIDIVNGSPLDGARVQLLDCYSNPSQDVTTPGDGTVRVFGKCLDAAGPLVGAPGDRYVHLWTCNNTPPQQWQQRPNGTLYQPLTDRCLDAAGSNNSAPLYLHACHSGDNQKWTIPTSSGVSFGKITGFAARCVDIPSGHYADGTAVRLSDCTTTYAQDVTLPSDNTLRLAGKCVDAGGPPIGNTGPRLVHLWSCNGTPAQKWRHNPSDASLKNDLTTLCLDTRGTENGAQLYVHPCNAGPYQQWKLPQAS